jgi:hypothetical protein
LRSVSNEVISSPTVPEGYDKVYRFGIDEPEHLSKPDELLALHGVSTELFNTLRQWFNVEPSVTLNLTEIDSAVHELGDPVLIAAMAMRKLQALHLLSTPGVITTTDVVVTIVQDLDRALLQAPAMRLRLAAADTDWDAAFAALDTSEMADQPDATTVDAPSDVTEDDPEVDRFSDLHAMLHEAAFAVLAASENEIRYFK